MYKRHEERRGWARDQMVSAKLPESMVKTVEDLLARWWDLKPNGPDGPDDQLVLKTFTTLAQGHAIVVEEADGAVYKPARLGSIYMRDDVRIAHNAYSGNAGTAHNGRHGVVVGVRNGDVIVRYTDGKFPPVDAAHHPPRAIEKRVK